MRDSTRANLMMSYRPEIDGLRAIAVVTVILFHADFAKFSGGFVGVDVFFVISGYLITSILIRELSEGRFLLLEFYERRARRILPALFFVLAVSFPFAFALMLPNQLQNFSQSVLAVALFVSNAFFMAEQADYFRPQAELLPLLHTWSLAVEEQYYIVFPLLLAALWPRGRRVTFWSLAAIAAASLLFAEWAAYNWVIPNFYLTIGRAWELLAGALVAFVLAGRRRRGSEGGAILGLVLILVPVFFYDDSVPFPGLYALPPVLGTVLIILFADPKNFTGWLLSLPAMVAIGLISYSAYLWHQPIFAFARLHIGHEPEPLQMIGLIAFAFFLAYVTWRFIEQPFRSRGACAPRFLPKRASLFAASATGVVIFASLGMFGHVREGLPERYEPPEFVRAGQYKLPQLENGYCFYSIFHLPELEVGDAALECRLGDTSSTSRRRMLLFGDSYAGQWEPFWDKVGQTHAIDVHSVTTNWCGPSLDPGAFPRDVVGSAYHEQCRFNRRFLAANMDDYDIIVLGGEWDLIEEYGYLEQVFELVDQLLSSTEAKVILMASPVVFFRQSVEEAVYFSDGTRLRPDPRREASLRMIHDELAHLAEIHDRVHFFNRVRLFGADPWLTDGGLPYSLDGGHISIYGSLAAADTYLQRDERSR